MAGNQLSLTNVINISVAEAQAGIGDYNTSNLALFTNEEYDPDSFGDDGFKIYLSPEEVATDFGTDSQTYAMATSIFGQKPNILAGNGYLVIIPMLVEVQRLAFSAVAASGSFTVTYATNSSAAINWNDSLPVITGKIQAIPGLEKVTVTGAIASHLDITFDGTEGNISPVTTGGVGLQTSAPAAITITVSELTSGETPVSALTRTSGLVQYFGLMFTFLIPQAEMLALAASVQALNKIAFVVSNDSASVEVGGLLDLLRSGNLSQTRGLYYGDQSDAITLSMMAAYAGRALSTNFDGSNTTETMHLKDLAGVQPDPSMTQTLLTKCQAAGADVYVSLQGVSKVFCSGKNQFFDQVYNVQWFVGALQVAGFNFLAQAATKVPQTEQGMDGLKDAYRKVCEQAVTNQYSAPGTWNSATTFGNQADFYQNVASRGYYIYSQPIGQQSQTARAARQAPLVQIALKEAGAIHSSNVIVFVNA